MFASHLDPGCPALEQRCCRSGVQSIRVRPSGRKRPFGSGSLLPWPRHEVPCQRFQRVICRQGRQARHLTKQTLGVRGVVLGAAPVLSDQGSTKTFQSRDAGGDSDAPLSSLSERATPLVTYQVGIWGEIYTSRKLLSTRTSDIVVVRECLTSLGQNDENWRSRSASARSLRGGAGHGDGRGAASGHHLQHDVPRAKGPVRPST